MGRVDGEGVVDPQTQPPAPLPHLSLHTFCNNCGRWCDSCLFPRHSWTLPQSPSPRSLLRGSRVPHSVLPAPDMTVATGLILYLLKKITFKEPVKEILYFKKPQQPCIPSFECIRWNSAHLFFKVSSFKFSVFLIKHRHFQSFWGPHSAIPCTAK